MAQRQVFIDGLGEVTLVKKKGNSNLRLSVRQNGKIYLSMPRWAPYISGEEFVRSRRDWLAQQLNNHATLALKDGDQIGKNHHLYFKSSNARSVSTKVGATEIIVRTPLSSVACESQEAARKSSEKALKLQSEALLPQRLSQLANRQELTFKELRFRKLTSRWGSCSSKGSITISIYLIQLPWELIDYVLLHELVHVRHLNHGPEFWRLFEAVLPNAKLYRKQIRQFRPVVTPVS